MVIDFGETEKYSKNINVMDAYKIVHLVIKNLPLLKIRKFIHSYSPKGLSSPGYQISLFHTLVKIQHTSV